MTTSYELTACPVCGGRESELLADAAGVRAEVEALWQHHTEGDVVIPLPELTDRLAFTHPPPLAVVRCVACGLVYRNPRERHVREFYEEEALDVTQLHALRAAQRAGFNAAVARLTALNGGAGQGIEVGSYAGAFLAAAAAAGWRFTGVDVNPAVVAFLREQGHPVVAGGIEQAPASECDVVAIWNCFDQLPDPLAAAHAALARLRPGGVLALRVPNGDFYARLRRRSGGRLARGAQALLARHNFLGFPYRHGFTARSLTHLLGRAGFDVIEVRSAEVLPVPGPPGAAAVSDRLLAAAERALRPLAGAPWLELYARRA